MNQHVIILISASLLVGCSSPDAKVQTDRHTVFLPAAAALAYTPPAAVEDDVLDLSRDGRGVYALGGFEWTVVDTTYVYQDDRQRYDRFGDYSRFERRAVSTSVTVRRR